jgi:biopolymer transport protein ExbB
MTGTGFCVVLFIRPLESLVMSSRLIGPCSLVVALLCGGATAATAPAPLSPLQPPVVERVEPPTVPVDQHTRITVHGKGFDASGALPVNVHMGNSTCPGVVVHSDRRITAMAPVSHSPGPVDVEVRQGGARSNVLVDAICYDDGELALARWYRIRARLRSAWLLLRQGGEVMLVLCLLSIAGTAWVLHCALAIRSSQIMPRSFLDKLNGYLARGDMQQAMELCQRDGCVFGRVAVATLRKAGESPQKTREVAQAAGSREASHLLQKISYLNNLGVIAPMLGVLGTVLGMILAFKAIGMGEGGKHILLAGAIHKAMITTAGGLFVGIPALGFYYYFRGKLLRIVTEMEQVAEEMADAASEAEGLE